MGPLGVFIGDWLEGASPEIAPFAQRRYDPLRGDPDRRGGRSFQNTPVGDELCAPRKSESGGACPDRVSAQIESRQAAAATDAAAHAIGHAADAPGAFQRWRCPARARG